MPNPESEQKKLVRAYVEALNSFDLPRLREIFAADAVIYGVLGFGGVEEVALVWKELHESLQLHLEILAVAEEGNQLAVRYRETGKFVGPFRGLPGVRPTGKTYEISAMEWFEFENGKIKARWGARDSGAQNRQIA